MAQRKLIPFESDGKHPKINAYFVGSDENGNIVREKITPDTWARVESTIRDRTKEADKNGKIHLDWTGLDNEPAKPLDEDTKDRKID